MFVVVSCLLFVARCSSLCVVVVVLWLCDMCCLVVVVV